MKMKKRNKLHLLAFMLVAALMMMATMPTVSARAEDEIAFAQVDNIDDEPNEIGRGGGTVTVPQNAYDVANYALAHNGATMQGYKGNKTFNNIPASSDAQKLPEGVAYKEYDVNPYVSGQNRGGERVVIGSDGSLWYTNDHYCSFAKM